MATFFFLLTCVSLLGALSYFLARAHTHILSPRVKKPTPTVTDDGLPSIPRTLAQVYRMMDYTQFEVFSAAVVIGTGRGHHFYEHTGGAGDQGVDAMLHNLYGLRVVVQSKFYASENPVTPKEVRDFLGAIALRKAVYGYFVTTSTFTKEAMKVVSASQSHIYAIDGQQLDVLLRHRHREIALALQEILKDTAEDEEDKDS